MWQCVIFLCDRLVWKRICAGLQLFAYVFITGEDPLIKKWRVGIPLTGVTLPYLCTCTIPEHGFPSEHVLTFYKLNDLRQEREVVVRFVDISWIVDSICKSPMHSTIIGITVDNIDCRMRPGTLDTTLNMSEWVGELAIIDNYKRGFFLTISWREQNHISVIWWWYLLCTRPTLFLIPSHRVSAFTLNAACITPDSEP